MSSIKWYTLLVLFLLFICLPLSNARRLGPMEKKLEMMNPTHLNTKNNEGNVKPEASSNASSQTLKATRRDKIENLNDQSKRSDHTKVVGDDQKAKPDDEEKSIDEMTSTSKRVSRSWKVPQKKKKKNRAREDQHPSFNLDYMQPSTHPPHHN